MSDQPSLRAEVIRGYEFGWSFTPLCGKKPRLPGWQSRPRETLEEAIAWARQPWACELATRRPMRSIGLRTGQPSGVAVVDIDAAKGAVITPDDLPLTPVALTGGGGYHCYFGCVIRTGNRAGTLRHPDTGRVLEHVDLRADGGQVVFPGSQHPDTCEFYRWMPGRSPDDVELAMLPVSMIVRPQPRRVAPAPAFTASAERRCMGYLRHLPPAVSGQGGHSRTFQAACTCWRFGLDEDAVRRVMNWWNRERCSPAWSERELEHKVQSSRTCVEVNNEMGVMLERRVGAA